MKPHWFPNWENKSVVIVASGPSAIDEPLYSARLWNPNLKFMAINESWRLAPWCDVLYGCDVKWWNERNPKLDTLKVCPWDCNDKSIRRVHISNLSTKMDFSDDSFIGWGHCSGFQAINLAAKFGASNVFLVGFDMMPDTDLHWHSDHENGLNNPTIEKFESWRKAIDGQALALKEKQINVINCSRNSSLTMFRHMKLKECIDAYVQ